MIINISLDTSAEISPLDRRVLFALLGDTPADAFVSAGGGGGGGGVYLDPTNPAKPFLTEDEAKAKVQDKPKATRSKKASPAPETAEEAATELPTHDTASSAPTLQDAVDLATKLVAAGESGKVREALATVGAKQVSKIAEADVAAFIEALA